MLRFSLFIVCLASPRVWAGCKVEQATDAVADVTTDYIRLGKLSPGVSALVGSNDKPTEAYPPHMFSVTVQRRGVTDLSVQKGDPGVLVLQSGQKLELAAFADVSPVGQLVSNSAGATAISVWSIAYPLTTEQLQLLGSDPLKHIRLGFGGNSMDIPIAEKKGQKAAKKVNCLVEA